MLLGLHRDIEINLRPLFARGMIKLISTNASPSNLSITQRGDLLFVENGCIKITGIHHKQVKYTTSDLKNQYITSLAQHKDQVYVTTYQGSDIVCSMFSYDLSVSKQLCKFRCENIAAVAVTEDHLVILDRTSYTQCIRLYTFDGKYVRSVNLPNRPEGIWPQPGNEVVVKEQSSLVKYSIATGNAVQQWRVQFYDSAVTTDSAGVIYGTQSIWNKVACITMYHPETGWFFMSKYFLI